MLHELLPLIDDLVLTAPLTADTRGIIGQRELSLLPRGAHVVNVGRGELIDEVALVASLQSGHVGGAALDVFVVEPLPTESPLWDMPNVIVTPHSAGGSPLAAQPRRRRVHRQPRRASSVARRSATSGHEPRRRSVDAGAQKDALPLSCRHRSG